MECGEPLKGGKERAHSVIYATSLLILQIQRFPICLHSFKPLTSVSTPQNKPPPFQLFNGRCLGIVNTSVYCADLASSVPEIFSVIAHLKKERKEILFKTRPSL